MFVEPDGADNVVNARQTFGAGQALVKGQRFIKLSGDVFRRIQRVARVLQDHRNPVAAQRLPAAVIHAQ